MSFLDWLFAPKPAISKEDALSIAQKECLRRNWPTENLECLNAPRYEEHGRKSWYIQTNTGYIGGGIHISIDTETGSVIRAGFTTR